MKEFFAWLFSENNSSLQIGLFDVWHFFYLFLILGGSAILAYFLRNKSDKTKEKVTRIFAYLTIGMYIADFFIMPLSDSYSGISKDKLPFHICTFIGVWVPFAEFNPRFKPIKTAVVSLSMTSSLMWMCYPGSALGGQPPFSYIIFQTFMFHGVLYTWGFMNLALGREKLNFRYMWKEFCIVLVNFVWACFGNAIYDDQNWFFIKESIFPFLPDKIMPFMVIFCVMGSCLIVYLGYYLVSHIISKHQKTLPTEKTVAKV